MLVQFRFRNFGPFRNDVVFDMRAIKAYKEHDYNLIEEIGKTKLLKVASIYGANASGKSNFVKAYEYFFKLVLNSFNNKDSEKGTVLSEFYDPYLFSADDCDTDTEFEGVYYLGEDEYKYGFVYNSKEICYEWLYRRNLKSGRKSTIFERQKNKTVLGYSVKKGCLKYVDQIEKDVLALSFFNRLNLRTSVFKRAFYCVTSVLALHLTCEGSTAGILDDYFKNFFSNNERVRLIKFLKSADVEIKDFTVKKNKDSVQIYTHHTGDNGKDFTVPLEIESDGTRKLIAVYSLVEVAIRDGKGLIIDELDMQLHPLLLKYIVDLFYSNNMLGQLVYTTHNTTFLDKKYFRRDQVWFIDKGEYGISSLYSLAEFKIRSDSSFEKEYLGGVYGAIPILKDFTTEEG